jgi:TonB family protein
MSVYLLPAPSGDMNTIQSGQNQCCTRGSTGAATGTIRLLAPSAPVWKTADFRSSLGLPKTGEDFHAKVMMSEYIPIGHYAVQDARPSGGWRYYSAPEWFVQGLQEYDAIFHTTDANRIGTVASLFAWARNNTQTFACCLTGLSIGDVYNGGATFMAFLAAQFGEDVHAKLLRSAAPTFDAALAEVTKPYALPDLFEQFRGWLATTAPTRNASAQPAEADAAAVAVLRAHGVTGSAVRVGGSIRAPMFTKKVDPTYPPMALASHVQGVVILDVTIGSDGIVQDATVRRSIPPLDQAALDTVRQWEYTPTVLDGVRVPVIMTVTVNFFLGN